jgi:hypothetical protein
MGARRESVALVGATAVLGITIWVVLAACSPLVATPPPDPDVVIRQPAEWPAHPNPAAGVLALREECSSGVTPIVATDDRGFGVVIVLMGKPADLGSCDLRRAADGTLTTLGGGAVHAADPVPDDALEVVELGEGPPRTPDRASADPQIEWRDVVGYAPEGTASVRVAVGSHVVEATVAGRLFVAAWPNDTFASLLVAYDANGRELARILAHDLFVPNDPSRLGS